LNWEWDEGSRVVYIATWWKYNQPENPNVVIGLLKDVDDIPETQLLSRFSTNFAYLPENLHETFAQTLAKRYPKPSPNQEQEQEQEQEQVQELVGSVPPASPVFLTIPLKNGEEFPVDEIKVSEFQQAYPSLDVRQQLREIRSWSLSNPDKRKTKKGILRHVNGWLAGEADKREQRGANPNEKPREEHLAEIEADARKHGVQI